MTNVLELLRREDIVDHDELQRHPIPMHPLEAALALTIAPAPHRTPVKRRRYAAGLVTAGTLAVAAIVVGPLALQGDTRAQEVLRGVAQTASAQAASTTSAGYSYSRVNVATQSVFADAVPFSVLERSSEERWIGPNGDGRIVRTPLPPDFPSTRDEQRWIAKGKPTGDAKATDQRFTREQDAAASVAPGLPAPADLPTDADALQDILKTAAQKSEDVPVNVKTFELVGALLRQATARPALRAALFTVASRLDGIELVGSVRDPLGRKGEAVAMSSDYSGVPTRTLLIFDAERAEALAVQVELLKDVAYTGGRVVDYQVLVKSANVASTDTRPSAP